MKIDPHDVGIRLNQARKFLMDGHKVQIVQNFRGREMMHKHRGFDRMKEVIATLEDVSRVDMPPKMAGRRITMILSPDKNKIDRIKASIAGKAQAAEKKAAEEKAAAEAQVDAPVETPVEAPVEAPAESTED